MGKELTIENLEKDVENNIQNPAIKKAYQDALNRVNQNNTNNSNNRGIPGPAAIKKVQGLDSRVSEVAKEIGGALKSGAQAFSRINLGIGGESSRVSMDSSGSKSSETSTAERSSIASDSRAFSQGSAKRESASSTKETSSSRSSSGESTKSEITESTSSISSARETLSSLLSADGRQGKVNLNFAMNPVLIDLLDRYRNGVDELDKRFKKKITAVFNQGVESEEELTQSLINKHAESYAKLGASKEDMGLFRQLFTKELSKRVEGRDLAQYANGAFAAYDAIVAQRQNQGRDPSESIAHRVVLGALASSARTIRSTTGLGTGPASVPLVKPVRSPDLGAGSRVEGQQQI